MAEETTDANTDTGTEEGSDVKSAGSSTDTEMQPVIDEDGLISTTEFEPVQKDEPAGKVEPETDTSDDAEQNTSEADPSEKQDFHKHPRFKELIDRNNRYQAKIDELEKKIFDLSQTGHDATDQPEVQGRSANFRNIMAMDDEDIVSELTENPKGFLSNLAMQISHEIRADFQASEKAKKAEAETLSIKEREAKTVQDFFADKEDGQAMQKDGRIKAFIKENPGHNEISAYHALAGESIIKSAVESAKKETEEKIYRQLKAKGAAGSFATLTGNRSIHDDFSAEKANPEKFGGKKAVAIALAKARLTR